MTTGKNCAVSIFQCGIKPSIWHRNDSLKLSSVRWNMMTICWIGFLFRQLKNKIDFLTFYTIFWSLLLLSCVVFFYLPPKFILQDIISFLSCHIMLFCPLESMLLRYFNLMLASTSYYVQLPSLGKGLLLGKGVKGVCP